MAFTLCAKPAFIFTHIPKTGGSSLFSFRSSIPRKIEPYCKSLTVMSGHQYLRNFSKREFFKKAFKFAIVRNPYDRYVSMWKVRADYVSIDEFTRMLIDREHAWYQIKPQTRWIATRDGTILTDQVLRFENYEAEIQRVFKLLGLPRVTLPHLRKTNRDSDYRKYYTDRSRAFVESYYKEDLVNFNYMF